MKGKIAFVVGAAVGYVLGSRAGRQRYEQIKRGAQAVWNTPPVQKGVDTVRGAAQRQLGKVTNSVTRAGRSLFASASADQRSGSTGASASTTAGSAARVSAKDTGGSTR